MSSLASRPLEWDAELNVGQSTPSTSADAVSRASSSARKAAPADGSLTKSDHLVSRDEVSSTAPVTAPHRNPEVLLAEWSGCVLSIDSNTFTAELTGVRGDGVSGEEEDAEIPLSDVASSDMELLVPGNFFRLCVFYETREDRRPRRFTQLVFRRLPAYRSVDLAKAAERSS